MDCKSLDIFLFTKNNYEIQQFETQSSVNDFPELDDLDSLYDKTLGYYRLPKDVFFKENQIYISKHNRFADMLEHLHDFIEINYVYSGKCIQTINDKTIHLPTGSICVLDRDVPHSIKALNEEDILINILINEQTFSSLFLFQLEKEQSLLANFLSEAFNKEASHDSFMIFDSTKAPQIHTQIQLMLLEYWFQDESSPQLVSQYLQLIITELMRIYKEKTESLYNTNKLNYLEVLDFIDQNYRNLKLEDIQQHFNYNSNYISNTLKKATGKNFQEILLEKKLMIAMDLIKQTNTSIADISEEAGFNSTSYFYRQFKKRYGAPPKQFQKPTKKL